LKAAGEKLLQLAVSAVVSVGFVAFAGKAVLWVRFEALQIPQDQVVKAVPQSEAVAVGASILLIFGFFGAIAALVAFLVDRGGRATPGMSRVLVGLATLEGGVAIAMVAAGSFGEKALAAVPLVALACIVLAATFSRRYVRFEDSNRPRGGEKLEPKPSDGVLRDSSGKLRLPPDALLSLDAAAVAVPLIAAAAVAICLVVFDPSTPIVLAGIAAVAVLLAIAWVRTRDARAVFAKSVDEEVGQEEAEWQDREDRGSGTEMKDEAAEEQRLEKHRPYRLKFNLRGMLLLVALALVGVGLPSLVLADWWLAFALGAVVLIWLGLWRIAGLSKPGFVWFGLAMFLSVPLSGTVTLMARNLDHPEAQPMALIRTTDGPDQAIQGLYVTETSDRVYFANIATEGCSQTIQSHSGRLLWVPKDEVVAVSVGPLQGIADAGTSALEMAYGLTPAVETPAAGAVSLTVPEKRSQKIEEAEEAREAKEAEAHAPGLDQRLENPGPAVRPNFGSGLSVVPEIASPGEEVELRLAVPNPNVDGFGRRPEGRTLRLNGVPVSLAREGTRRASNAEYVKTGHNQVLSLDKLGLYGVRDGAPFLLDDEPEYEGPRFVRLADSRVAEVRGGLGPQYGEYLKIRGDGEIVELGTPTGHLPEVRLAGEKHFAGLESGFLRQAWHSDRIAFDVPEGATSGVITIDCGQLAGAPLLRIAKPPQARIEARMRDGSKRVVFDGKHSRDAGKRLTDRWTLGRHTLGTHERVALRLRPRKRPYRVRLVVTDPEGVTDTAELLLLRLPEAFFHFGSAKPQAEKRLEEARRGLERLARRHPPSSIELDGNADDVGSSSFNLALSLHRAERVRKVLLAPRAQAASAARPTSVPVTLRAFGESCPIVRAPGRQSANRRVDVFILDPGDTVATPKGCKPGREEHTRW
jgi:outer membrane protein OmpA-like peptidoglycan-associated protein